MPKTNDQIQRDFAALPWYKQAGVAADDLVRITANGLTFGLPDYIEGAGAAERTREARVRSGVAGDIAKVGSLVAGGKGVLAAGKAALNTLRAVPTAAVLAKTAGVGTAARYLTGTAGPGVVPVVAPISRAAMAKGAGLGLAGLAGLGLAASERADPTVAAAPKAAKPMEKPARQGQGQVVTPTITPYDRQLAFLDTVFRGPLTMREAQAYSGMLPAPPRARTAKDTAFGQTAELSRQIYESQIASIGAQKDAGTVTAEQAQKMTQQAMVDEFQRQSGMQGLNPMSMIQAQLMAPNEEE